MAYQFDFVPVLANTDLLLRGALFTLELTAIGALLGVALGTVGAVVRARANAAIAASIANRTLPSCVAC